ncbi:MAG TPA: pitrilysin family protein, partial [Sandaracinaceae bacterium LLY-WYZ-13_1]|nr:pitrilysin family protein [Sandaracinaceae bacterium LLY-WYZ-13_1]
MKRTFPTLLAAVLATSAGVAATLAYAQQADEEESSSGGASSEGPLQRLPIQRARLDNGLRVVMSPDRTVPTVAIAVYYDVGSRNEVRGRSGFAHLFEHMMFQGSANVAKGEHFQLVMNRGGSLNGTTSHDRTNYFETLPSNELALGLWLEADRMRSLAVTAENFENQRQVVMEEWRQSYRNQPYAMSFLRINELAYGDYWPYAHSTIGDIQDLQNAPLSAVQEFFDTYYTPNNAVLSISGDFDPEEAMTMVRRYFGDIPSREVPEYDPGELPPQTRERHETMQDPLAERPAFHIGWHIPP